MSLEFEESTAKAIHLLTKDNVGKRLAVVISDRVIMAPVIRGAIPNGKLEISGMSREEAVAFVSEIERPPGKSPAIRKR